MMYQYSLLSNSNDMKRVLAARQYKRGDTTGLLATMIIYR